MSFLNSVLNQSKKYEEPFSSPPRVCCAGKRRLRMRVCCDLLYRNILIRCVCPFPLSLSLSLSLFVSLFLLFLRNTSFYLF